MILSILFYIANFFIGALADLLPVESPVAAADFAQISTYFVWFKNFLAQWDSFFPVAFFMASMAFIFAMLFIKWGIDFAQWIMGMVKP